MAYVRQVEPEEATGSVKTQYDRGVERTGKVFNILRIQSLSPAALDATMQFYTTVMHGQGPLRRWERELLATVASKLNGCVY
jgi:alkylhydroperoxidase family enzyme